MTTPVPKNPLTSIEPISGDSRSSSARRFTSLSSIDLMPGIDLSSCRELLHLLGRQRRPPCDGTVCQWSSSSSVRPSDSSSGPVGRQVHIVLEPHAAPARKIDPRLDRHHRVQRQGHLVGLRKPRRLMHLQPQAVAQRMAERVPEPAGGDHLARQRVGLPPGHPGAHLAAGPRLRRLHQRIDGTLPVVGPPRPPRSG